MSGPKLNERATVAGERSGTKASARYLRSSASKAREVLVTKDYFDEVDSQLR